MTPPRTFYEPGGLDVLFYGDVVERRTHDIEFYTALARRIGGPVIDMGCGTGRISIAIAQQGIDVTGVDSSAAMLELARAELAKLSAATQAHVRLIEGNICELAISLKSPLVICPFRTMQR